MNMEFTNGFCFTVHYTLITFQTAINSLRISSIEVLVHTLSTRNTIKLKMLSKEDYS